MLALSLALLQAAWAGTGEIAIGMSAAFRGPSRGLGIERYRGSMSYLQHVNAAGGIHGRTIVVKTYDDGYQPIPAIENTIDLVEKDDVLLLFDYVGTPTVTRVLPLLKRYSPRSMYLFFPFTGAQPQREPPYDAFVFNLRASYREETEGLVDNFVRDHKTRIAVFYQADAYGRSGWDGVRKALAKHGLGIVGEATYRRGTLYAESFQPHVTILRKASPDALISVGAYAACAALIRDIREAGWDIPIANISFVGSENLLRLLLETGRVNGKNYTTNLINSQVVPSYEDTSLPAVREYRMDEYKSKGTAIADSIQNSSVEILLNRDVSTLQAIIDQFLDIQGVSYVFIVDAHHELVAHTFVPTIPAEITTLVRNHESGKKQRVIRDLPIHGVGEFLDISAPILTGVAGYVHVGMDKGIIAAQMQSAILIIDDDPMTRDLLERYLSREGFGTRRAASGQEGTRLAKELHPSIITLDVLMPEMDGFEFLEELRRYEAWRTLPVVVLTAKDITAEDRLRLDGHVERVFQKRGYSREALLAEVGELIRARINQQNGSQAAAEGSLP